MLRKSFLAACSKYLQSCHVLTVFLPSISSPFSAIDSDSCWGTKCRN